MNPHIKTVKPKPDFTVTLVFANGETKRLDVKPYLDKGLDFGNDLNKQKRYAPA